MADEQKRLSDDRGTLGEDFENGQTAEDRELAGSFVDRQRAPARGIEDPAAADRHRLGESFADPNALDDQKLGRAFEEENASSKHRHKPATKPKKPINWRLLFLFIGALLLLFLIIFLVGFLPRHRQDKRNEAKAKDEQSALPVVEAVRVGRPQAAGGLVVPGTTTPLTEAYVYARSNGYIKRRLVDIGDHVRQGQLLAVVDSPDLDQQVDQARQQVRQSESQLAQQQTQLALTKITNDRYRALVAKGVFSRQDGDQREADYQAQVANVAAAERNVEAFRANLRRVLALQSYERVTAPFTGVITARNIDVGSLISVQGSGQGTPSDSTPMAGTAQVGATNSSGTTGNAPTAATPSTGGNSGGPLFSIAQVGRLRILISVPEGYAGSIHRDQAVALRFQELPQSQFSGKVTRTSASIDQNTRTLLVEVQVDNTKGDLMSGMYAVATFAGAKGQGPITIVGDAIAVRQNSNVVAVLDGGKVHLQRVDVGRDFGPVVEILNGLHVGQTIAAVFTDDVREGAKIKVQLQKDAANQAPAPPPQNTPPGGSSQYGDQSITDANLQGQAAQQNKPAKQGGKKIGSAGASKQ